MSRYSYDLSRVCRFLSCYCRELLLPESLLLSRYWVEPLCTVTNSGDAHVKTKEC